MEIICKQTPERDRQIIAIKQCRKQYALDRHSNGNKLIAVALLNNIVKFVKKHAQEYTGKEYARLSIVSYYLYGTHHTNAHHVWWIFEISDFILT